ncbi:hypothetical protein S40288_09028 [Stachybotrys chartarum IBT 40288]|nr:hypothetical protein S40288_09028 [Stachybotrys chartarum IBT 40288]
MSDWNTPSVSAGSDSWGAGAGTSHGFKEADRHEEAFHDAAETFDGGFDANGGDKGELGGASDDKCFGCGEAGHRRAECPNAEQMLCRYCKQPGHIIRDCPDKPPMVCENCGEEGHIRKECENARKLNRDNIANMPAEDAWEKLKRAAMERDVDDAKEAVQEYVKALQGAVTYREIQEACIDQNIGFWLIATERGLLSVFTNMDLQGNLGKKYSISYRFSEFPNKPREKYGWPETREEILSRLDDAGDVVNTGLPVCMNCGEVGHISKDCTTEKRERPPAIPCSNCGTEGHRLRDCPEPRIDKFACKNCGKSGHKASDCEEPPNMDLVECRKCNEKGHFAKDCPQGGGRACRNCGQEGHMAKDCDQPRNMDMVTCRNCEKTGHMSRECPQPRDWSKVQCSNCQEFGHTKVRCKKPPAESQDQGFPQDGNDGSFAAGDKDGWGNGGDADAGHSGSAENDSSQAHGSAW